MIEIVYGKRWCKVPQFVTAKGVVESAADCYNGKGWLKVPQIVQAHQARPQHLLGFEQVVQVGPAVAPRARRAVAGRVDRAERSLKPVRVDTVVLSTQHSEAISQEDRRDASISDVVQATSLCGLGQTAPNPVLSTLKYFRHEYEEKLRTDPHRLVPAKP